MKRSAHTCLSTLALLIGFLGASGVRAQALSPNGVKTLNPPGAIKSTGTWNLGTRAGDFVFVAGMRGIDPATNALVQGDEARVLRSMQAAAECEPFRKTSTRPS